MGRYSEVNQAVLLDLKTYDGNTSRGVQARVYNDAGTEQAGSPFTLTHFARGNYKSTSWTPTVKGVYIVNYEVFTDGGFTVLDTNYTQVVELVNINSSLNSLRDGTAQAGASGTITLDASASAVDNYYRGSVVQIISGTGAGQSRTISSYVGSTKVATMDLAWGTAPDNTSKFAIRPEGTSLVIDKTGYSLAAASIVAATFGTDAIDANALASNASDEIAAKILTTPANKLTTNASGFVTLVDASITAAKFAADAIDANALASNASDEIAAKILVTPSNKLATNASGFVTLVDASITAAKFAADAIDANALATSAADEIAAKILATPANLLVTDATGFVTLSNASLTAAKFAANAIDANALATSAADEIASKILLTPANLLNTNASGFVTLADASMTAAKFAADSIDSNALATSAVTEIVSAIFGKVIDTKTFEQISEILLAYSTGKIVKTGSNYAYMLQDDVTTLFTLVSSTIDRTRI